MVRVIVDYDECKYIWDRKNRQNNWVAFATKAQMITHAARKLGVSCAGHPEIRDYATKYLEEGNRL